jgi:hypothetical protein
MRINRNQGMFVLEIDSQPNGAKGITFSSAVKDVAGPNNRTGDATLSPSSDGMLEVSRK